MSEVAWAVDAVLFGARGLKYRTGWEHGAALRFEVEPCGIALARQYQGDARFTPFVVVDRYGVPVDRQRRLVQTAGLDGLRGLRATGFDVQSCLVIADLDLPKHALRRINRLQYVHARDVLRSRGLGSYSSRAGVRAGKLYAEAFPPEEYAARNDQFQTELTEILGDVLVIDTSSREWTRLYRTPWCQRDGDTPEPWIDLDMEPYALDPIDESLLTDCCAENGGCEGRETSDRQGLARVKAWAAAVEPPICGDGQCRRALWNVALQCHLFGLARADAVAVVTHWAARSRHDWSRTIEGTVDRALNSPFYKSGARLDDSEDALSDERIKLLTTKELNARHYTKS